MYILFLPIKISSDRQNCTLCAPRMFGDVICTYELVHMISFNYILTSNVNALWLLSTRSHGFSHRHILGEGSLKSFVFFSSSMHIFFLTIRCWAVWQLVGTNCVIVLAWRLAWPSVPKCHVMFIQAPNYWLFIVNPSLKRGWSVLMGFGGSSSYAGWAQTCLNAVCVCVLEGDKRRTCVCVWMWFLQQCLDGCHRVIG